MSDEFHWSPGDQPGPNQSTPPPWTRVYRRNGRYAHLDELIYSAHYDAPASWDEKETWYGTGSQEEYEKAKEMPLCPRCLRIRLKYAE